MRLVWGTVDRVVADDEELQQLEVLLDDGTAGRAIATRRSPALRAG